MLKMIKIKVYNRTIIWLSILTNNKRQTIQEKLTILLTVVYKLNNFSSRNNLKCLKVTQL